MTDKKELEVKIVKYIDYIYLNNFIKNTISSYQNTLIPHKNMLAPITNENKDEEQLDNEWKIFSIRYMDESLNILYFIKTIKSQPNYNYDLLLITLHIYTKICNKYAHLIENYTHLFASVYISINMVVCVCEEYLTFVFMAQVLNISNDLAKKMISTIDKFMDLEDIYFGLGEKEKIISDIL